MYRKMDDAVITIDVDWSPDFAIYKVVNILIDNNCKATWFLTHDSPVIRELFRYPELFDFGIHPNFLPESTHGSTDENIMKHLLKLFPGLSIVRTHALFQSSLLLKMMTTQFNIKIDSSIFLREVKNIEPFEIYYDGKKLLRIPIYWTEDGEMNNPHPNFMLNCKKMDEMGLKVFVFHPIHIYLNSNSMHKYKSIKNKFNINSCNEENINKYVNKWLGSETMFNHLIQYISYEQEKSMNLSDIARKYHA